MCDNQDLEQEITYKMCDIWDLREMTLEQLEKKLNEVVEFDLEAVDYDSDIVDSNLCDVFNIQKIIRKKKLEKLSDKQYLEQMDTDDLKNLLKEGKQKLEKYHDAYLDARMYRRDYSGSSKSLANALDEAEDEADDKHWSKRKEYKIEEIEWELKRRSEKN